MVKWILSFVASSSTNLDDGWALIDANGNFHRAKYVCDGNRPLLTTGWQELRSCYDLSANHAVWLRYVGCSTFQITVFRSPSTPRSYPRFHSLYPRETDSSADDPTPIRHPVQSLNRESENENEDGNAVSFSISLTHYKATKSQLVCLFGCRFMFIFVFVYICLCLCLSVYLCMCILFVYLCMLICLYVYLFIAMNLIN